VILGSRPFCPAAGDRPWQTCGGRLHLRAQAWPTFDYSSGSGFPRVSEQSPRPPRDQSCQRRDSHRSAAIDREEVAGEERPRRLEHTARVVRQAEAGSSQSRWKQLREVKRVPAVNPRTKNAMTGANTSNALNDGYASVVPTTATGLANQKRQKGWPSTPSVAEHGKHRDASQRANVHHICATLWC